MAVRRLPATPGWICVLNNYQNNIHQNENINNIIVIYIKASIYIDNNNNNNNNNNNRLCIWVCLWD